MFSPYLLPCSWQQWKSLQNMEFPSKNWKTSIFGISGGMPKPMKNIGKMDVFSLFATLFLVINICKTLKFHPETGKHQFLESVGACPNLWKTLEKWMFSYIVATVGLKKSEKQESQTIAIDWTSKNGCWKLMFFFQKNMDVGKWMFSPCFLVPALNEILILFRDAVSSVSGNWLVLSGGYGYRLPLWFWWLNSFTVTQQFVVPCKIQRVCELPLFGSSCPINPMYCW